MKTVVPRTTMTKLADLRAKLAHAFGSDTAAPGTRSVIASAGHCAAVAAVVHAELGGQFLSTVVDGQSHWFNRIEVAGQGFDADLTGDQFGFANLRISRAGELFSPWRLRTPEQLNVETLRRARLLAERAGLRQAERRLSAELSARSELAAA